MTRTVCAEVKPGLNQLQLHHPEPVIGGQHQVNTPVYCVTYVVPDPAHHIGRQINGILRRKDWRSAPAMLLLPVTDGRRSPTLIIIIIVSSCLWQLGDNNQTATLNWNASILRYSSPCLSCKRRIRRRQLVHYRTLCAVSQLDHSNHYPHGATPHITWSQVHLLGGHASPEPRSFPGRVSSRRL